MRKHISVILILFLALFLVEGSALALNFSDDYWTPTDFTTGGGGSADFSLVFESAWYESDFGLFTVGNDDKLVYFEVFNKSDEPGGVDSFGNPIINQKDVDFQNASGNWQIKLRESTTWTDFSDTFGFYFGVYTGGKADPALDYRWFTDTQYNQKANGDAIDTNIEHVATWFDGVDSFRIYLDDQVGGGDRDWNDMIVSGNDLAPAPVPEPATMILFGSGLMGLAAVARKKIRAERL